MKNRIIEIIWILDWYDGIKSAYCIFNKNISLMKMVETQNWWDRNKRIYKIIKIDNQLKIFARNLIINNMNSKNRYNGKNNNINYSRVLKLFKSNNQTSVATIKYIVL